MLLADFVERTGRSGVDVMIKMDGPRPRNKWTVRLWQPPYVGEYWRAGGDCATLDEGLAHARKALAGLPGDWSWLDEPISDTDAYAELFEAVGETGHEGHDALDERAVEGAAAQGVHDVSEVGPVGGVGHAATLAEGAGDGLDVPGEQAGEKAERSDVQLAVARQAHGVHRRDEVRDGQRIGLARARTAAADVDAGGRPRRDVHDRRPGTPAAPDPLVVPDEDARHVGDRAG